MALTGATFTYEIKESIILDGETRNIITTNTISGVKYMDQRTMLIQGSSGPGLLSSSYADGIQPVMRFSDYERAGTYPSGSVQYIRITQKNGNNLKIRISGSVPADNVDFSMNSGQTLMLLNTKTKASADWTVSCNNPVGYFNFNNSQGIYAQVFGDDPTDYPALNPSNNCNPYIPNRKYTAIQDAEIEFVVVTTY
jgi:hypothetical protein